MRGNNQFSQKNKLDENTGFLSFYCLFLKICYSYPVALIFTIDSHSCKNEFNLECH